MSLTVKAYLTREGQQQPEIRRFAVDADATANYNYFIGKVAAVFPGLHLKEFTIGWKDNDNDLIIFSSDEELTEALGYVTDGVFKVYIQLSAAADGPSTGQQGPGSHGPFPLGPRGPALHFGVTCDGCNGPVVGLRHKCDVCEDYDLCEGCKSTGLHSEHSMRTIDNPLNFHQLPFGPAGGTFQCGVGGCPPMMNVPPPPPMPPMAGMPPPPPCLGPMPPIFWPHQNSMDPVTERRQRRAWRRWMKQAFREEKQARKAEKRGKLDERRQNKNKNKKTKARKMDTDDAAPAAANSTSTSTGATDIPSMNKGEEKKKKKPVTYDDTSSSSSSSSSSEDSDVEGGGVCDEKQENTNSGSPGESYLKNIGQSVAAMLNPLGIDVAVDIEHRGRRRRCHGAGGGDWFGTRRGPGFGARGSAWGPRFDRGGGAGFDWGHGWGAWNPFFPSGPAFQGPAGSSTTQPPQAGGQDREARSTNSSAPTGAAHMGGGGATASPPGEVNDWMFVASEHAGGVEGATRAVAAMNVSEQASSSTSSASATTSANASAGAAKGGAVARAVELMKSMGFSDDDGWLTALLTAHSADVNAALEFISSSSSNK